MCFEYGGMYFLSGIDTVPGDVSSTSKAWKLCQPVNLIPDGLKHLLNPFNGRWLRSCPTWHGRMRSRCT